MIDISSRTSSSAESSAVVQFNLMGAPRRFFVIEEQWFGLGNVVKEEFVQLGKPGLARDDSGLSMSNLLHEPMNMASPSPAAPLSRTTLRLFTAGQSTGVNQSLVASTHSRVQQRCCCACAVHVMMHGPLDSPQGCGHTLASRTPPLPTLRAWLGNAHTHKHSAHKRHRLPDKPPLRQQPQLRLPQRAMITKPAA
jgi:hypothetical protein